MVWPESEYEVVVHVVFTCRVVSPYKLLSAVASLSRTETRAMLIFS